MSTPALATVLSELEDELFYAVLDVAMDIDQTLTVRVGDDPIRIQAKREGIRLAILYPEDTIPASYRYTELRRKGLMLLQKQGGNRVLGRS